MGIQKLPYEGSVWLNTITSGTSPSTVSGCGTHRPPELAYTCAPPIPESMKVSGWYSDYRSSPKRTVWRVQKDLPNGRYHQIMLHTNGEEGIHIHAKTMLTRQEIPTIDEFGLMIVPELVKTMTGLRKKTKRKSINSDDKSKGSS